MRVYSGKTNTVITVLMVIWVIFQLWFSTFGIISAINLRAIHCLFLLMFTFLLYPPVKKQDQNLKHPQAADIILIAMAFFAFGFLILKYTEIARSGG
ncbi:MAG: TRAP transporter permease, partial [Spirochaetales bacterium]|nr:TRAP transporter permease [Spirochaetales bacterium]